jgi:Lar family restriction alleviation protein
VTTPQVSLLPCPFCGGKPYIERAGTGRASCIVVCEDCGVRHESADEYEHSGQAWNRRSHPRAGLTGEQIVACDAGIEALTWYSDATNEPDIRDYRLRLAATLRALAKGEE